LVAAPLDIEAIRAEIEAARGEYWDGKPQRSAVRLRSLRTRVDRLDDDSSELVEQRARLVTSLAAVEFETGGRLDAALGLLAEAEVLTEQSGSHGVAAIVRGQRGLLLLRAGHVPEALAALDSAAELIEFAEPTDQMTMLLNRGTTHMERGSLDVARADLERCVQIAVDSSDRQRELRARHNLGYAEFLAGQIPRALAVMDQAEGLNDGPPHPIGLLDRARVLREAGLTGDAERLLGRAAELFREGRLFQDLGETRLAMAECALVEGDAERARRLARAAERVFARRRNVRWQRKSQLLVLRAERRAIGRRPRHARDVPLQQLGARARQLAEACRAEGPADLARSAELLALECLLRAGTPETRTEDLPLPRMRFADPLPDRLLTREARALAALNAGDRVRAAREVRRGLVELGAQANRFGSLELRTAMAVHGVPLARIGLEIADRNRSPAEFFAAVERGRAISIRLARVGPPTDERTAELLAALRQAEERIRSLDDDPAAVDELARLRARVAGLQRDIRSRAWELEGDPHVAGRDSARIAEVRLAARAEGTEFATYVAHHGRWTAVLASGRRARRLDLGTTAEVDELVQRVRADLDALAMPHLPAMLADAVRRSLDAELQRLDELLLGPLGVDGMPLVISCGAPLSLLPWSLLPSRAKLPVVVTPSATAWLRAQASSQRTGAPRVAAVAGPGLRRAEDEARRVQASWPGAQLLVGDAATTDTVRSVLTDTDVVHVAAHGTHQQDSPLFSSVRVVDGPLYAYELEAGERPAPCVVLSACEAGLATVRPGDEGLGLTSVLLHLGSRSVLAGVARVRDDVAARVMEDVHRSMAAGTGSAAALAEALAREDDVAPFVAFGASW
jgi:tetratricopeptide (TPR) repeat protein